MFSAALVILYAGVEPQVYPFCWVTEPRVEVLCFVNEKEEEGECMK